MVIIKNGLK